MSLVAILFISLLALAAGIALIARGYRSNATFRCAKCGYDLRGSLDSDQCPECGATLDGSSVQAPGDIIVRQWYAWVGFMLAIPAFIALIFSTILLMMLIE